MLRLRRILRWAAIAIVAVLLAIQFIRPARTNPNSDGAHFIEAQMQVPDEVKSILNRSCIDCHSNNTRWPWYSNVAPVSWWLVDHVREGREHLNFSEWGAYSDRVRGDLLYDICDEVKKGAMPLRSYTRMHWSAVLSTRDVDILCGWTESELEKLEAAEN